MLLLRCGEAAEPKENVSDIVACAGFPSPISGATQDLSGEHAVLIRAFEVVEELANPGTPDQHASLDRTLGSGNCLIKDTERRLSATRHGERSAQAGCKIEFTHAQSGSLAEIQALTEIPDSETNVTGVLLYDPERLHCVCAIENGTRPRQHGGRLLAGLARPGHRQREQILGSCVRGGATADHRPMLDKSSSNVASERGCEMPQSGRSNRAALVGQVERLQRNCGSRSANRDFTLAASWNREGTEVDFLYRDHLLICDSHEVDDVLEAFDQIREDRPVSVTDGPVGLKVLDIGDRDAGQLSDALADVVGDDVVTPNHVLDVQGFSSFCPATEPVPWRPPVTELGEPAGPGRSRVAVVDTGYRASIAQDSGYGRFSVVDRNSETDDAVYARNNVIQPYGGHGTATTARLLAVSGAGSVSVRVRDSLVGGAVDELTIVQDLERTVANGVDIVSIQAGLYARAGRSPKAFNAFYRRVLRHHPETVIVVAAGNDGSDRPFWPAAYDWCTAVGALTHGGDARTGWTNYGYWVDVYASGENIVVPFPNGTYEYLDGFSVNFTQGHAIWSGTSFAAPAVAGMIARRMIERDVDAPTARDIVLAEAAVAALPSTGPRVLV
jgi:hypothetical protein